MSFIDQVHKIANLDIDLRDKWDKISADLGEKKALEAWKQMFSSKSLDTRIAGALGLSKLPAQRAKAAERALARLTEVGITQQHINEMVKAVQEGASLATGPHKEVLDTIESAVKTGALTDNEARLLLLQPATEVATGNQIGSDAVIGTGMGGTDQIPDVEAGTQVKGTTQAQVQLEEAARQRDHIANLEKHNKNLEARLERMEGGSIEKLDKMKEPRAKYTDQIQKKIEGLKQERIKSLDARKRNQAIKKAGGTLTPEQRQEATIISKKEIADLEKRALDLESQVTADLEETGKGLKPATQTKLERLNSDVEIREQRFGFKKERLGSKLTAIDEVGATAEANAERLAKEAADAARDKRISDAFKPKQRRNTETGKFDPWTTDSQESIRGRKATHAAGKEQGLKGQIKQMLGMGDESTEALGKASSRAKNIAKASNARVMGEILGDAPLPGAEKMGKQVGSKIADISKLPGGSYLKGAMQALARGAAGGPGATLALLSMLVPGMLGDIMEKKQDFAEMELGQTPQTTEQYLMDMKNQRMAGEQQQRAQQTQQQIMQIMSQLSAPPTTNRERVVGQPQGGDLASMMGTLGI